MKPRVQIHDCGAPDLAERAARICDAEAALADGARVPELAVVACADLGERELALLLQLRSEGKRTVVLSRTWVHSSLHQIFEHGASRHVLGGERAADETALRVTLRKLFGAHEPGARPYLGAVLSERELSVRGSADRAEVLRTARGFAEESRAHPRLIDAYCGLADELVSNAVYHATIAGQPTRSNSNLPRESPVELPTSYPVQVSLMRDAALLAICVRDSFGALVPERALDVLATAYGKGADQVETRGGGAGLGLYSSAESSIELVLNLRAGVCTEAIGLVAACPSFRDAASRGRAINVFAS